MEIFLGICGSGIFAALAAILAPLLLENTKYNHKKKDDIEENRSRIEDIREDIRDYQEETTAQFDSLRDITEKKIDDLKDMTESRMDAFENKLEETKDLTDSIVKNEVARTYINIRKLALHAIKTNRITIKEKEYLLQEYDRYKRLPGSNGFLEETIHTVNLLRVTVEDDDLN